MFKLIATVTLTLVLALAQEGYDPGQSPPEPPADTPACHNYHDNEAMNCHCPKAMMEGGTHDGTPINKDQQYCKTYCLAHKCLCLSPIGDRPIKKKKK